MGVMRMNEWKNCKLGEICEFQEGYVNPSQKIQKYFGNDIKWLRANDLTNSYVYETSRKLSRLGFESAGKSAKLFEPNTVAISKSGTIGRLGILKDFMCGNRAIINIKAKKQHDIIFIFYMLKGFNEYFQELAVGSVQKNLYIYLLESLEVSLPPLPEQKAIAAILSSLDDKIDLLHRQNKTLEAMAETLFRQWFVEEVGEDWEEVSITDLFEIRDGTHDSPKQTEFGKPLITSKHIHKHRLDIENAYLISEEDFNKINQRSVVDSFDILFSMIGTIGLTYLEQSKNINYAIKNIGLFKTSQNKDWAFYTYLWLISPLGKEFIFESKSGSTQQYISLGSLRNIYFNKPSKNILDKFNSSVDPLFSKIFENTEQIQTLTKLRDTLLPKLMSGEVRVKL
jgi:type I restriction enzyme S subunit